MDDNVIKKLNKNAPTISENDIDSWIVDGLLETYQNRIVFFAYKAFDEKRTNQLSSIAIRAFREAVKKELKCALRTFYIKKEHWKSGRNINSYLVKTISNLSNKIKLDDSLSHKTNALVCPACKVYGRKEFLVQESKLWRCGHCTNEEVRLGDEIGGSKGSTLDLQARYRLVRMFSVHSRKGKRCPDCNRFIPQSIDNEFNIACPYPDCIFIGDYSKLEDMNHPVSLMFRRISSLDAETGPESATGATGTNNLHNMVAENVANPEVQMDVYEQYSKEKDILLSVIDDQLTTVKRMNSETTLVQKVLMYEAYKIMIDKYPEEMVSYLVHRKQLSDFPIQARIFQEYVSLVENYLPFTMIKGGEKIHICSLIDPNLSLFLGKSVYEAYVDENGIIPNKTKEEYVGGRKFKNYGPCFIGRLIDVINVENGKSILNNVKEYGFVNIKTDGVDPGIHVEVSHFRIPSHYEMDSLVFLQRIRRQIVDSVYYRLHNKKR
jgi:hypothetical protein